MKRQAVVAGQFYPARPGQLREMIESMVDSSAAREEVIGLVSPHAGYIYSGPVAGATLSRVKLKDTVVILGPKHTGYGQPFSIMTEGSWTTPLGEVEIDTKLAEAILGASHYLQVDEMAHRYEHSIEVQLPFLQYFKPDIRLVPIMLTHAAANIYREIGQAVAQAIRDLNRKVVIIASSDMTHYESQDSAKRKDTQAIEAILKLDEDELLKRVEALDITMCGYAPAASLLVAAKELGATGAELVRYQTSGDTSGDYSAVVGYAGIIIKGPESHPIVKLAQQTVESYVKQGKTIAPPDQLTPEMSAQAGVFVSIHKFGELRGCIGTFEPQQANVALEVITNAISSATRDPRFPPIAPSELEDLDFSVDVLTSPLPAENKDELDLKRYGVIVAAGWRRGLLLPDLEGVDTVEQQLEICRLKAGISPNEPVKLYKFEVKRYK